MSDNKKLKIRIHNYEKQVLLRELIDEFLPNTEYELVGEDVDEAEIGRLITEDEVDEVCKNGTLEDCCIEINLSGSQDRNHIKRELFRCLNTITGRYPDWGILTGVRPVKLAGEIFVEEGAREDSWDEVHRIFKEKYYLTEEKNNLIEQMYRYQMEWAGEVPRKSVGVYIGIPFCPTRCLYCSFASNQVEDSEIERYYPALISEVEYCGRKMKEKGLFAESVYFGGGTPTTLNEDQLRGLIEAVYRSFDMTKVREFSIEAGRPDTITEGKLRVMKEMGVNRISINPQSMKQRTLDIIGRSHTPEDIEQAFRMAEKMGFDVINADLIAGLPEEEPEDFEYTLRRVLELGANNVTVHTLAVKRSSRLIGIDRQYNYKVSDKVEKMLKTSRRILDERGFLPYYLYRQKHMAGGFENTGYSLPGTEGLYNTRIMDEHQSILAIGAGGISKRYYPETDKIVRVPNVINYCEYINRTEEMCQRKEDDFFTDYIVGQGVE